MKKYLLFGGYRFYPEGGWNDLNDNSDSLKELISKGEDFVNNPPIRESDCPWAHIVDISSGKIIWLYTIP